MIRRGYSSHGAAIHRAAKKGKSYNRGGTVAADFSHGQGDFDDKTDDALEEQRYDGPLGEENNMVQPEIGSQ